MSSTGYGPRSNAKLQRLIFDGDETKFELWEARFLGYMQTLKLKKNNYAVGGRSRWGEERRILC